VLLAETDPDASEAPPRAVANDPRAVPERRLQVVRRPESPRTIRPDAVPRDEHVDVDHGLEATTMR
jgi:hypothetical protein